MKSEKQLEMEQSQRSQVNIHSKEREHITFLKRASGHTKSEVEGAAVDLNRALFITMVGSYTVAC